MYEPDNARHSQSDNCMDGEIDEKQHRYKIIVLPILRQHRQKASQRHSYNNGTPSRGG